ncbi:DNA-binding response OmpR family regulator [Alteromonas sp. 76-1]|jgi:DNA-binding response OmpR family regulator|uniref:response regulator transcription factor n=1 Tax=unclassified Alteromonas TaxID=2614992 RepID=UPI000C0F42C2|nr:MULTISPECIES: response regulator transcription factor [unclassified Alteromonas]MBO7922603.1 response regulator transcription factor [Alteromonas sp. K632G]PHS57744.1 MAG: DNA-binding response regulator [Alteromonas sp.]VEL96921.1 DNA-binding response OmpR family regulator [Alteromonas sp. 76-1]|tara:strand:+ start:1766 stop:2479 length:714 start_codon:yes stop_codon:yes gene_type:complete
MTDKILIVEDDQDIANLMRVNLLELGVEIEHQTDGKVALECALSDEYAIVILDVMLPSMSGLDICRKVRDALPMQSIIMLTSKTSETDRVLGLELGADDYMTKPFSVRELQARVRSQLRKYHVVQQTQTTQQQTDTPLKLGRLVIDQRNHQVFLSEEELVLTATEFELLHHLASHPGQVFSRSQLLESVWGYHHSGYEHTVNSHINRLRSKLENDATAPQIVQTVWGVGYKFNPQGV